MGMPKFNVSVAGRNMSVFGATVGAKLAVLDMQGRVISVGQVEAANFSMTLPRSGLYVIRIGNQMKQISIR